MMIYLYGKVNIWQNLFTREKDCISLVKCNHSYFFFATLSGETSSGKSDEFFEKWQKFRPTKISPVKVSPDEIIKICLNDFFHS